MTLIDFLILIITFGLMIASLIVFKKVARTEESKRKILIFLAWACFITHISILWVSSLYTGNLITDTFNETVLWPTAFCNLNMYFLLIAAHTKKESKTFQFFATFVGSVGLISAIGYMLGKSDFLGLNLPMPDGYGIAKSWISHAFLMLGSLWLVYGGFIKIRVTNFFKLFFGIMLCNFIAVIFNFSGLFIHVNNAPINENINAMWLRNDYMGGVKPFPMWLLQILVLGALTLGAYLYELILKKKYVTEHVYSWSDYKLNFQVHANKKINVLIYVLVSLAIAVTIFGMIFLQINYLVIT